MSDTRDEKAVTQLTDTLCAELWRELTALRSQLVTLQAERDEWMISSGVHAKKAANLVQRCGQLEAALQDVSEAWREIKWRGVGNEFTGDADRCDVQKIEQALEDAARVLAGKE